MYKRTDPKVRKSFVRHSVQNVKSAESAEIVYDVESEPLPGASSSSLLRDKELNQPALCSSASVANYLYNVKKSLPPPMSAETIESNRELSAKVTKKLNFHFNNRIYKNLIALNASNGNDDTKINKKVKKPLATGLKKDLEPNIEDFYQDEEEIDQPPKIPNPKIKFKPIKKVEDGSLHRLIASFENL